jgi:tetratricopeptide (TPR) repeat protein
MTPEQLFDNYKPIDRKNNFQVIHFCEKNVLTIQNLDEEDLNKLTLKRNLLSDYGYALAKSGQSSKAIPILEEAVRLHEKNPAFENDKDKLDGYQYIVFLLGESFYKAGETDRARKTFENLTSISPDNDSYKSWLIATKNYSRKKFNRMVFISFTVWLLISVVFRAFIPKSLDFLFGLAGLTLFIVWTTLELKSYLVKRRYR